MSGKELLFTHVSNSVCRPFFDFSML